MSMPNYLKEINILDSIKEEISVLPPIVKGKSEMLIDYYGASIKEHVGGLRVLLEHIWNNRYIYVRQDEGHIIPRAALELKRRGYIINKLILDDEVDVFNIVVYIDIDGYRLVLYSDPSIVKQFTVTKAPELTWIGNLLKRWIFK